MRTKLCFVTTVILWSSAASLYCEESSVAPMQSIPPKIQTAPVQPHNRARLSGGVIAGSLLTKIAPVYPPEAKSRSIGGTVVLHAIIGEDGRVQQLEAVSGPEIFKQAALDAVRQWTYRPYLLNGEPTEVDTTITVNFSSNTPQPNTPQQVNKKPVLVSSGLTDGLSPVCPTPQSINTTLAQLSKPLISSDTLNKGGAALGAGLVALDKVVNAKMSLSKAESLGPFLRYQSGILDSSEMNKLRSEMGPHLVPTSANQVSELWLVYKNSWNVIDKYVQGTKSMPVSNQFWLSDQQILIKNLQTHGFDSFEMISDSVETSLREIKTHNAEMVSASSLLSSIAEECARG